LPSWPTRDQSTSVASAKYVLAVAAAEIFVCRLSQSMFTHLTLMPVCWVNLASTAWGGASEARATVMVAPRVLVEPPLALSPPPQPAVTSARATSAATAGPRSVRVRERRIVLGMTPPRLSFPRCEGEAGLFTNCATGDFSRAVCTIDAQSASILRKILIIR
jgi:hypothetical protein